MKGKISFITVLMTMVFVMLFTGNAQAAEVQTSAGAAKEVATMLNYTDNGYYALKGGDEDWYKFQTPATLGYTRIYFKNTGMDKSATIEVYNFIDERVYNNWSLYRNDTAQTSLQLESGQTYYIKITGGNIGSTYVLDLNYTEDEAGNSKDSAAAISCNQDYTWSMDGDNDTDYATFTASTSGKYKFTFKNTGVDSGMNFEVFKSSTDERLYNNWSIYQNNSTETILDLEQGQTYYFYFGGNGGATGNYTFTVNNQTVKTINLSKTILTLANGTSTQLTAQVLPANAFNPTVTWASNDNSIADVDSNGNVTARKPGETIITCTANDGNGAISTCNVIVKPMKITYVESNSSDSTSSSIKIKWNGNDSVNGYTIYCYDSKTKKYSAVKSVSANTYEAVIKSIKVNNTSKKLTSGTTYTFKVAAYVLINNVKYYGEQSDSIKISTTPAAVTLKSVTNPASNTVKLTWAKVSGATGYNIYIKDSYSDSYYFVSSVSGGSKTSYAYTDYNTGKYVYKVSAYRVVNGVIYEGAKGNAKTVNKKK